ncbi:MAG: class I SAM-dependent methyltransferase [Candidatus Omnitrophica bacterium]|nr:class I SAM-dependent methyltransferase [Candidatus Omnitrophota bacterium]
MVEKNKKQIKDYYNDPEVVRRWGKIYNIWQKQEFELILELVPCKGKSVLDIGCACGVFSMLAVKEGAIVTAVDNSPAMIRAARQNSDDQAEKIEYVLSEAEKMPFGNGSFDMVYLLHTMPFIRDKKQILSEISRILKKNGHFIISMPNPFSITGILGIILPFLYKRYVKRDEDICFLNPFEIRRDIIRSGYENIHFRGLELLGGEAAVAYRRRKSISLWPEKISYYLGRFEKYTDLGRTFLKYIMFRTVFAFRKQI